MNACFKLQEDQQRGLNEDDGDWQDFGLGFKEDARPAPTAETGALIVPKHVAKVFILGY